MIDELDAFAQAVKDAELLKLVTTHHPPLDGDDFAWLLAACERVADRRGFAVIDGRPPHDGLVDLDEKWIALAPNPPNHHAKVMLHELAHVVEEAMTRRAFRGAPSIVAASEIYAETTAYLVAREHGLDTSRIAIPYVAFYDLVGRGMLARRSVRLPILRTSRLLADEIDEERT